MITNNTTNNHVNLEEQIKCQGDVVRALKSSKAEKSKIDGEVQKLLNLKALLKEEENASSVGTGEKKLHLKTPKGMRDYGPDQMSIRENVFALITKVFKRHGGQAIDTPICELKDTLTNKYGEDTKLIYDLADQGGEKLALRYDLTVPFARYLAQNKIMSLKRYHIGKVYRRDNPAITRGRYREFYQCDFDIAGPSDHLIPDTECLRIVYEILKDLKLTSFVIKVNHRLVLNGLLSSCGVPANKFKTICSAIDKMDKCSWEEVKTEMCFEKGLDESVADQIGEYIKLNGSIELLDKLLEGDLASDKQAKVGLEELKQIHQYSKLLDIDAVINFDLSLARGLDYYTGMIFEAVLTDGNYEVGSIAAGGRYDDLVKMLSEKQNHKVPCVGISIGIERIFTILEQKCSENEQKFYPTACYVAFMGKGMTGERFKLLNELWNAGISAEHSYKSNEKILSQFQFCESNGIPIAVMIGENEISKGVVKLRNVKTREEQVVTREALINEIGKILEEIKSD